MQTQVEPESEAAWLEEEDELPGVCAVGVPGCDGIDWQGVGVFVAPQVVLTTATAARRTRVVRFAGVFGGILGAIGVERRVVHPDHDPDRRRSDLAMLRLSEPVVIRSARLAARSARGGLDVVRIVGYGAEGIERSVRVRVVPPDGMDDVHPDEWTAGMPLAEGYGSLAFLEGEGRPRLAGIASRPSRVRAHGCVYVDVLANGAWILATAAELGGGRRAR
jgi:hypothetical protein